MNKFPIALTTQSCFSGARAISIFSLLPSIMKPETYWVRTLKGQIVRIELSRNNAGRWAVWLDDTLICDDFGSASDAAFYANRKEFTHESARDLFRSVWVPPELHSWSTGLPEQPKRKETRPPPGSCTNRLWKPGTGEDRF